MDVDEDEFEDLFNEADLLPPSSQGPLIDAAADLDIGLENDHHDQDDASDDAELREQASDHAPPRSSQPLVDKVYPNGDVIDEIEAVMEHMVDALLNDKNEISITLKTRQRTLRGKSLRSRTESDDTPSYGTRTLRFPGRTEDEAWRFSVVLRIMELMHEALRNDVTISKRDMYYRDPALFGSQSHVDRYVDDIAFTFGISRSRLNIAAAAKGLVAGALEICRRDGSIIDAASDKEGILVPTLKEILSINTFRVEWILVIEKEATFRSIAGSDLWSTISSRGIIITGKGYPDLSTRALLRFLSTASPQNGFTSPPVYGLADFDPDGISILSVYKHGSKALAHESGEHAIPGLQRLGLHSKHLSLATTDSRAAQGLLALTSRDRKKAATMLDNSDGSATEDHEVKQELQLMLMLNVKAELQLLDTIPNGMVDLLRPMTHTVGLI